MKILLYGGCHALILRDLFAEVLEPETVELDLLINFQLIESGQPFPYERLDWCDVIIFSPIENKGDYNTDRLLERCHANHKPAFCFPWMEWHGYCPGAVKGAFKGRFQWYYPQLFELAAQFTTFDAFAAAAVAHFPADDIIDQTFAVSSERLASSEQRHAMPIRISDFITQQFRASRLFLISDHPSLVLYLHVMDQILDQLGLPRSPLVTPAEPQWRWRTPIFPRVTERLGLTFDDREWVDDELIPGRMSTLDSYLSLYFHRDSVILGPIDGAQTVFGEGLPPAGAPIGRGTRIVARRLPSAEYAGLHDYVCLETLIGPEIALAPNTTFSIDATHWRSTWSF